MKKIILIIFLFLNLKANRTFAQFDSFYVYIETPRTFYIHTEVMADMINYFNLKKQTSNKADQNSFDELIYSQNNMTSKFATISKNNILPISLSLAKFIFESSQAAFIDTFKNSRKRDTLIFLSIVEPKQKIPKKGNAVYMKIKQLSTRRDSKYFGLTIRITSRYKNHIESDKTIQVKSILITTEDDVLSYKKGQLPFECLYYSYTHTILVYIWNELVKYGIIRKSN